MHKQTAISVEQYVLMCTAQHLHVTWWGKGNQPRVHWQAIISGCRISYQTGRDGCCLHAGSDACRPHVTHVAVWQPGVCCMDMHSACWHCMDMHNLHVTVRYSCC